jgi:hypothetical protein
MAKKQAIVNETAAAAAPARAASPKTPRVKAAQHSKAVSSEPVVAQADPESVEPENSHIVSQNSDQVVAQIAYGYWESRGYQGGNPLEDWVRAEHEYNQLVASARH